MRARCGRRGVFPNPHLLKRPLVLIEVLTWRKSRRRFRDILETGRTSHDQTLEREASGMFRECRSCSMAVDYLSTIGSVLETRGSLRPICDMSDAVKGIWERVLVRLLNEVTARRQSLPSPQTPQNRLAVTRPRLDREPGRPTGNTRWPGYFHSTYEAAPHCRGHRDHQGAGSSAACNRGVRSKWGQALHVA